jgi:hypothetical protein
MIDFLRNDWWLAIPVAGVFFVVTHALLVKLIADSEKNAQAGGSKK